MPRLDPTDLEPGNSNHLLPHNGTNTFLPNLTIWRSVRRPPDPTPSETPPHITGDSRPNVTARPRHTSVRTTTGWPYLGNPNLEARCPTPRYLSHTAMGTSGDRHHTRGRRNSHNNRLTCHT